MMSMLVVGVVSAIASSTASAQACTKETKETFRVCLFLGPAEAELELLEGATFSVSLESAEPHKLKVNFSVVTEIECTVANGEAGVFKEEIEGGVITFTSCALTSANKTECELVGTEIKAAEINAKVSLQTELEGTEEALRLDLLFVPETTGGSFAKFSIGSISGFTCTDAVANGKVTGEQLCYYLEPIEADAEEHLFECPSSGSELKFDGNTGELQAEFIALMKTPTLDNSWSIVQGE
jgi:hypothetical protein